MSRRLTKDQRDRLAKGLPKEWDVWTYRRVKRTRLKNCFYFKGQIVKIKYFATFGAFDHKNRWVDYYDVGLELKPTWWVKFQFFITSFV